MKNTYRFEKRVNTLQRQIRNLPARIQNLKADCILAISQTNHPRNLTHLKQQLRRLDHLQQLISLLDPAL